MGDGDGMWAVGGKGSWMGEGMEYWRMDMDGYGYWKWQDGNVRGEWGCSCDGRVR